MTTTIEDLIGLTEMANLLNLTKNEANAIRQRPGFPTPKLKFAMGPAWDKLEVLAYVNPKFKHRQEVPLVCTHCGREGAHMGRNAVTGGGTGALASFDLICVHCGGETSVEIFNGRGRLALFTDMVGGDKEDA